MTLRPSRALLGAAFALGLVLIGSSPASAAPPSNDDFDAAILFTAVPLQADADTTEATRADDDPSCIGPDTNTVWYAVRLASDADIVLDTFGSDYDTTLSAWTGTRGDLTQVACNDDSGSLQSRIQFTAAADVTYYVMAGGFPGSIGGQLVLHGAELPPAMQLTVTLAATGSVTSSGAAVIHGTLTCSRPGDLVVTGTLREQIGKKVTVGSFRTPVACSGTAAWQATVLGETGIYRRGSATAVAVAEFVDNLRQEVIRVRASGTVQLS
ncbi:MAG TPA: hypothetical protein VFE14_01985 [Micromonosporaceae bacterium]|jgi:hypothetical protein|nr:hypothetical protein [Micromonosporaceae bacterium]